MRVSCTTLESFRRWSDPEQEWMSEDELLASIRGEWTPTHRVDLGQAFGRILEDPGRFRFDMSDRERGYLCGEFAFSESVIDPALDAIGMRGVFEAKAVKRYGAIDVAMKADHVYGSRIDEFKTTLGTFDIDKYMASYQWRYLLDGFGACKLRFIVFLLAEDAHKGGAIRLRDIEPFNLYSYSGMSADCEDLVNRFASWARIRGVDKYLEERQVNAVHTIA